MKIVGGAFYMGYNFAPLSELELLSTSMEWWKLLLTVLFSVGVTYGMVFSYIAHSAVILALPCSLGAAAGRLIL